MKKVLVVDWLDKYGGAERVIALFQKTFHFEKTYALVNVMAKNDLDKIYNEKGQDIEESKLKYFHKRFRYLFFTFHYFIDRFKVEKEVELIVSSSHSVAKGIKKSSVNQLHICYLQARNFKYIWDDFGLYFGKFQYLFYPLIFILRKIDRRQAFNPDYLISNSNFVKNWVKRVYNLDSEVIYPPVDLTKFELNTDKEDYFVAVGRIVAYKRFDIIIEAFNQVGKRLIVIGDGNELPNLKKKANSNIEFKGFLDSTEIYSYVSKAKAFIHSGVEDFGIAPIEAQACGTPVIAFGEGGVLETVKENETGIFFYEQTEESLIQAIKHFESLTFIPGKIREHALQFSEERFVKDITCFINEKYFEYFHRELV